MWATQCVFSHNSIHLVPMHLLYYFIIHKSFTRPSAFFFRVSLRPTTCSLVRSLACSSPQPSLSVSSPHSASSARPIRKTEKLL